MQTRGEFRMLVRRAVLLVACHAAAYAAMLASWRVLGECVLAGRIDRGWMTAWVLLLATVIPFRVLSTWNGGVLAAGFGGLLRERLLMGTLRLDPQEIKRQGAGELLGRTFEAEAVETLAVSGGTGALLALVEVAVLLLVMGWALGMAFAIWLGAGVLLARRLYKRRLRWTAQRLALTHDLVEKMSGYRTRIVQQTPAEWHRGEDDALARYVNASREMDAAGAQLARLYPRGWLLVGIVAMSPAFLRAADPMAMGISIGAILLGFRALERLAGGALQLAGAWIAWRQVRLLFDAADRAVEMGTGAATSGPILEARNLVVRHEGRADAVIRKADCTVNDGDWILLEGPSGGGKSTLASVLAGVRTPASGLLLAGGLDMRTLGARGWRKMAVAAPQYYENHVFSGTMAFNLLLGRQWPPSYEDLDEARQICEELGLGPLLERMPGGMNQMVGETGWQLSQGERSRLFIARALLQDSRMAILDESFAALDPENLRQALECALRRPKALLVIAHP